MREIVEAFPRKITFNNFPTAEDSCGFGKKSSNLGEMNLSIIDPGGYESIDVSKMVKDGKPGQWHVQVSLKFLEIEQEHPQFVIERMNSASIYSQDIQNIDE